MDNRGEVSQILNDINFDRKNILRYGEKLLVTCNCRICQQQRRLEKLEDEALMFTYILEFQPSVIYFSCQNSKYNPWVERKIGH